MKKQFARMDEQSRRDFIIRAAGMTAAGLIVPGVVFAKTRTQSPGETEGPYWLDGMTNRSDLRTNSAGGMAQTGFVLRLGIIVVKLSGTTITPVSGAKVDIWHCNASGVYSGVNSTVGQDYLRGYQLTDAHGAVGFTTIYPGWYSGRTEHIHMRVRQYSGTTATYNFVSQLFSSDSFTNQVYQTAPYSSRPNRDTTNATDSVYTGASQGNGGTVSTDSGDQLLLTLGKSSTRANGSFAVVL